MPLASARVVQRVGSERLGQGLPSPKGAAAWAGVWVSILKGSWGMVFPWRGMQSLVPRLQDELLVLNSYRLHGYSCWCVLLILVWSKSKILGGILLPSQSAAQWT